MSRKSFERALHVSLAVSGIVAGSLLVDNVFVFEHQRGMSVIFR